jgi:cytochrome c oxidase subunit II
VVATAAVLGGCGDHAVFSPEGPDAGRVAGLGWFMVVTATVTTIGVFALLAYGLFRRRRAPGRWHEDRIILAGGVVLPLVVLLPLSAATVAVLAQDDGDAQLHVEVIGHQFWWELRYPDQGFETANEIHIPVDTPVELTLESDDVIHSLWVPELGGKTDLVPGRTNTMELQADEPGVYRGQCAEFCGIQHAKMVFLVIADTAEDFDAWAEDQARDAAPPGDGEAADGLEVLESEACAGCHTVRGTEAQGQVGPDLTHLADRRTLASGILPNTPEDLYRWIDDTWEVKEGSVMPPVPLDDDEVDALVAYLDGLT